MDLDETFTEALDGCSLEPNLTILSQTKPKNTKPTLNLLWNSQNKLDLDETFNEASDGMLSQTKPNHTKPNHNKPTLNLL